MLNDWWSHSPSEKYWMEISDRHDLGGALIAPKIDEKRTPFYDLVSHVRPGDVVFHWSTRNGRALVGSSTVAAMPSIVEQYTWTPKNGEARTTQGWTAELTDFTPLAQPLTLAEVRAAQAQVLGARAELEQAFGEPVYFPFYLYGGEELRAQQGYVVKFPASLLAIFPQLSSDNDDEVFEVLEDSQLNEENGHKKNVVRPGSVPRVQDPKLRGALERHAVKLARAHYKEKGAAKVKTRGKPYDLKVKLGGATRHVEVKGSSLRLESVALTRNEVVHANNYHTTDLFVVDEISWKRTKSGGIKTSGGRARIWSNWVPDSAALKIVSYSYALPAESEPG